MKKKTFATLMLLTMLAACLCAGVPVIAEVVTAPAQTPINIDLTGIASALMGLLATVITAFIIPWLRAKLGDERLRAARVVLNTLVKSAEQIYGDGRGKEKLIYVKEQLERRGMTIDVDEIEAAVYNLGHAVLIEEAVEFTDEEESEEDEETE